MNRLGRAAGILAVALFAVGCNWAYGDSWTIVDVRNGDRIAHAIRLDEAWYLIAAGATGSVTLDGHWRGTIYLARADTCSIRDEVQVVADRTVLDIRDEVFSSVGSGSEIFTSTELEPFTACGQETAIAPQS